MGDLRLTWDADLCAADLSVASNDIVADDGLETAVLLSLFLDRRADDGDVLPDGDSDRRGWWGDAVPVVEGDRIGSRLWLLERARPTQETAARAEEYALEALAWLVEDRVADSVAVTAAIETLAAGRALTLAIEIYRPGRSDPARYRYDGAWQAMEG